MSTRSYIGKMLPNNTVSYIYCHHDGYPDGVGKMLVNFYNAEPMLNALLDMGNLSALGPDIGLKNNFERPDRNFCLFYNRDRGRSQQEGSKISKFSDFIDYDDVDYHYLFDNGKWRCFKYGAEIELCKKNSR